MSGRLVEWRQPRCFGQLIGKEQAVRYLSERIRCADPQHVILDGRAGSGRATTARIYARALHCRSAALDGSPCNACETCRAIINDEFIDTADSSALDWSDANETVQQVRQAAIWPPWLSRWRTILIRDAEAVPTAAWDVLLKTIERPDYEHVFIFTTAQLASIPEPIRSRCHISRIGLLAPSLALEWLDQIASVEGISCEPAALRLIVHASRGRPGWLLDNFSRVLCATAVTIEQVRACLDLTRTDQLARVWQAILSNDPDAAGQAVAELPGDPPAIMDQLREALLFLLAQQIGARLDGFDPMFGHCPDDVRQISGSVSQWGETVGLSMPEAALIILEQLSGVEILTPAELDRAIRTATEQLHAVPATPWRCLLPSAESYTSRLGRSPYLPVGRRVSRRKRRWTSSD